MDWPLLLDSHTPALPYPRPSESQESAAASHEARGVGHGGHAWDREIARCAGEACGISLRQGEGALCVYCKATSAEGNGNVKYQCRECDEQFEVSQKLAAHYRAAHPKRPTSGGQKKGGSSDGAMCCELCGGDLSPFARSVVSSLLEEGFERNEAVKAASIAQRSLRKGVS